MKYVDAHCHLKDLKVLPSDIAIAITNSAKISDWINLSSIAHQAGVYGAIGIHPWYVSDLPLNWLSQMRNILLTDSNFMIGEIGLDKYKPDMPQQIDCFVSQLKMAHQLGRIVHIHCVGGWDNILTALSKYTPPAIVFHGFDASNEVIKQLLRYRSYFSFGQAICNPLRQRAINALRSVPVNRILSETDSDAPSDVINVVQHMAEILGTSLADITETIYNNAMELLKND